MNRKFSIGDEVHAIGGSLKVYVTGIVKTAGGLNYYYTMEDEDGFLYSCRE